MKIIQLYQHLNSFACIDWVELGFPSFRNRARCHLMLRIADILSKTLATYLCFVLTSNCYKNQRAQQHRVKQNVLTHLQYHTFANIANLRPSSSYCVYLIVFSR